MSEVVAQFASIVPPDRIDIYALYNNFRRACERLDDLKHAREKHEQRSLLGRLFNSGELKKAQLDAQEVQADFSKILAQLVAKIALQPQQLVDQQKQLGEQQRMLDAKAEELAQQNIRLEEHQAELKDQAAKLRTYVTDLLNVQGLTDKHGEKLIEIATEVMATRDNLLTDFGNRMQQVQGVLDEQQQLLREALDEQSGTLEQRLAQLQHAIDSGLEQRLQAIRQSLLAALDEQRREVAGRTERLDADLALQVRKRDEKHRDLDHQLSELRDALAEQDQTLRSERSQRQKEWAECQAELHVLRNEQSNGETHLRRAQRHLMAGLCGLALAFASALAGFAFWSTSKPVSVPVEMHKAQTPAP